MRKYLLEIIIGILVVLSIGAVLALGYLSYTSISSIVTTIQNDARPSDKLNHIKELALELEKAENSVRIYAFTHQIKDLSYYNKLIKNYKEMVDTLRMDGEGNEKFLANVDTIQMLVQNKIRVWNEMIPLYGVMQTSQYLDTLSGSLETKITEDSIRKSRNIFKKVFQRNKKTEVDKEQIVQDIEQHQQQDQEINKTIRKKELELAATNSQLTERLYNLIRKMEEEEARLMADKVAKVNDLAEQTYIQIDRYAIAGVIAALLVILIILRYTYTTRASQRALRRAKAEAEKLAAAKELFVANVSHEIRTPVNLISGFTSQLLQKKLDEKIREDLLIVKSSSDHLARVVDDVLDFSKLQTDKMKLYPVHFSLKSVVEQIYQLFDARAGNAEVTLKYTIDDNLPPYLYGDPVRLKQVLINLLGNAIKFTPKGNVWFSFQLAENQSDEKDKLNLELTVKDDGIGIDKEKLEIIFEDFTQAESDTTKKYGGTGLGLSIVKKLIDLHEGSIQVESNKGSGTQFTCLIPYHVGDVLQVETIPNASLDIPASFQDLNVLIVDDEDYNRKLINNILKKWRVPNEEAVDGIEAIEKLKTRKFDVVLLDLRMPRLDGMKVTHFIRETLNMNAKKMAIILITAAAVSPDDEKRYKKSGINSWLPKPFEESELLDAFLKLENEVKIDVPDKVPVKLQPNITDESSLNLDDLYHVANNDEKFVEDMLQRLLVAFDEGRKNIQKAIDKGNSEEIGEATHKMASPSRHIGASRLLQEIKSLEELAASKADPHTLQNGFDLLEKEIDIVSRAVEEHLKAKKKKDIN